MQYFSLDRIKSAIEHLQEYDSKWVIVPLVFAVNGVGEDVRDLRVSTVAKLARGLDVPAAELMRGI